MNGGRRAPTSDPGSVNELRRRITAAAAARSSTVKRLQSLIVNVTLAQMLPPAAVKGGTGLKLRLGDAMTRQTPDLDAAFRGDRDAFLTGLSANLRQGWGPFTGTVIEGRPRPPAGVPSAYVMQPYTVKLLFHGRPFGTVAVELGYDELEATTSEPIERVLAPEVLALFSELGLGTPAPVRVLPLHHQIAQKLHACTEPGNERAHDLVDLQLLAPLAGDGLAGATTRRLFTFRRQHSWPALVIPGPTWTSLYADAAEGLDVLADLDAAIDWTNHYIARINA
jgi:hypothetical protein